ncbi:AtpZ/AtpI family protein [uncultured Gemmiger sp.]|uniref:AtpZ/AtpI family protein n=1 Tax=uncultured Gemmiger sp. TaxID=1623490 RepID=UPI0025D4EDA7|nr:AtpZ/AtpI family protein [uncultured Gemmiger sp.]
MKDLAQLLNGLVWFTQLGISLVVPLLLFVGGGAWLVNALGAPMWVMFPAFVLGLGTSGATARRFYLTERRKAEKRQPDKPVGFNDHL